MPPKIIFYTDPDMKIPHDGNLPRVKKGKIAEATIYCKNEGDGTLLDPTFKIIQTVEVEKQVKAEIISPTPKLIAPNEKCCVTIRYVGDGKWGWKKAYLDVEGEHAD